MNFLEHISEIDKRIDLRREEEYKLTIFGADASANIGIGLGSVSTTPNIFGGSDIYDNGSLVGHTQPNIFGGVDVFSNNSKVGYSQQNIFGGQTYHF